MAKKKKAEVRTFSVPVKITYNGDILIDAASADEAKALVESGNWEDDTFGARAEITDCEVVGKVRECNL